MKTKTYKKRYILASSLLSRNRNELMLTQREVASRVFGADAPTGSQVIQVSRWEMGIAPVPPKYMGALKSLGIDTHTYVELLLMDKERICRCRYREV